VIQNDPQLAKMASLKSELSLIFTCLMNHEKGSQFHYWHFLCVKQAFSLKNLVASQVHDFSGGPIYNFFKELSIF
jgi:hydroxyacyl-ACP dehydratase HTD2-like protein with hotdog domain